MSSTTEVAGEFSNFVDDPYLDDLIERAPLTDETDVIVIGGGFGGLLAGARLREHGVTSIRMIEKGGDFGGTWYWNRYPGAMCDVESYVYLPAARRTRLRTQREVCPRCGDPRPQPSDRRALRPVRQRLLPDRGHGDAVDDDERRWIVSTSQGDEMTAKFVVMANGPLHRPKLPGIEGINDFEGRTFHTSRWDYDYTGGGPRGGLIGLAGKRVGIIGTGATAVQCVPHLGEGADELYVFQRTPSSIDVRNNRPTDPTWAASLEPGWQTERMQNFNALVSGQPPAGRPRRRWLD